MNRNIPVNKIANNSSKNFNKVNISDGTKFLKVSNDTVNKNFLKNKFHSESQRNSGSNFYQHQEQNSKNVSTSNNTNIALRDFSTGGNVISNNNTSKMNNSVNSKFNKVGIKRNNSFSNKDNNSFNKSANTEISNRYPTKGNYINDYNNIDRSVDKYFNNDRNNNSDNFHAKKILVKGENIIDTRNISKSPEMINVITTNNNFRGKNIKKII